MIEAFKEGDDIHAATAAKVYKISIDKVTREQRSKAKTANFGIIYGISVFGTGRTYECRPQRGKRTNRRLLRNLSPNKGIYGQKH